MRTRSNLLMIHVAILAMGSLFSAVSWGDEPQADASAAKAQAGQKLVMDNCFQCHRSDNAKYPEHNIGWVFGKRYTLAGWKDNVDRMEKIALRDEYLSEPWPAADKEAMAQHLFEQTETKWTDTERLGMLHYSVVHFPIALLFVVGFLEVVGFLGRWPIKRDMTHLLLLLAAISAAAAAGLGLLLVKDISFFSEDLMDHRTAGLATLALTVGSFLLREVSIMGGKAWSRWAYRILLVVALVAVGATGHLGGTLVHGEFLPPLVAG